MSLSNQINLDEAFEYFEATADVGFYAYGSSLEEAYGHAGLAMFNVISDTDKIEDKESRHIEVVSEDLVSLLYDYLEELLFLHDTEFLLFSKFDVKIYKLRDATVETADSELDNALETADSELDNALETADSELDNAIEVTSDELIDGESVSCDLKDEASDYDYKLICEAYGEEINWDIHPRGSEVKAITFHLMDVKKEDSIFKLRAILDL